MRFIPEDCISHIRWTT